MKYPILLISAFCLLAATTACKKSSTSNNVASFEITDLEQQLTDPDGNDIFTSVGVHQLTGTATPVTITITGLPASMTYKVDPAISTPDYTASIQLIHTDTSVAGVYPAKLIGTSATGTKSYDFTVTLPSAAQSNWCKTDSEYVPIGSAFDFINSAFSYYVSNSGNPLYITFTLIFSTPPATGGNYTVVNSSQPSSGQVSIGCKGYISTSQGKTAAVTMLSGGKTRVSFSGIQAKNSSGAVTTLTGNVIF